MNTGTYYVFEYNGPRQIRNLGFFKILCHEDTYQIHLCIRGIAVARGDTLPLYAFCKKEDREDAFLMEEVSCEHHSISTRITVPLSHFPESLALDNIDGFFLMLSSQSILAAHDSALLFDSHTICFSPPEEKESETEETPVPQPIEPSPQESPKTVQKINRNDLSRLPRRYWNLANNSFLLHGYHNYNHLLLIEEDGHYIVGVPGIKDKYETRVAKMFGFSFFSTEYVSQLNLTSDEKETNADFGYWCCTIPSE